MLSQIFLFFTSLVLAGCNKKEISEMNPKDLPDVTSFQDEFTREFVV
ncbi:hypothetical protein [Oceanobacillus sojae]